MSAFLLGIPRGATNAPVLEADALLAVHGEAWPVIATTGSVPTGVTQLIARGPETTVFRSDDLVVLVTGALEFVETSGDGSRVGVLASASDVARRWQAEGESMLASLAGGFALALWDGATDRLVLQVDAFGVRSLFLRVTDDAIVACTEVTPLLTIGGVTTFDTEALPDLLVSRHLTGARTVWKGIRQVTPGRRVVVNTRTAAVSEVPVPRFTYGEPDRSLTEALATSRLRTALFRNMERLRDTGIEDVVVLLSGGIDSSIVAAVAAKVFPRCTAVTFSIDDFPNPELPRSQAVADRLGLRLHVVRVQSADVSRLYPWISGRLQEPSLHYNNPVLVRMLEEIREIAPVVLAGEFAGAFGLGMMAGTRLLERRKRRTDWLPSTMRRGLAGVMRATGQPRLRRAANVIELPIPKIIQRAHALPMTPEAAIAFPVQARAQSPSEDVVERMYDYNVSHEDAALLWICRAVEQPILRRNARFSDALGLRYHYPLQDVDALDLAAHLTPELKCDPQTEISKRILRTLCAELVGRDVSEWPKLGFPTPDLTWMQGPLAEHFESSLADNGPLAPLVNLKLLRSLPAKPNQQTLWTVMTLSEVLRQGDAIMHGA